MEAPGKLPHRRTDGERRVLRTRAGSTRPGAPAWGNLILRRQAPGHLHVGAQRRGLPPTMGRATWEGALAGNKRECSLVSTPQMQGSLHKSNEEVG